MTPGSEGGRGHAPPGGGPTSPGAVARALGAGPGRTEEPPSPDAAGVLFLLHRERPSAEPALLLTKRSARVRQPGDLCCPGGSRHRVDVPLGLLLRLPGSPLRRSPGWELSIGGERARARLLSRYWACALRETWEEIGLSPFGVQFLGPLPVRRLAMFRRTILPLVGWIDGPRRFRLNWEVNRLVPLPLPDLMDPGRYAVYRLEGGDAAPRLYPCFLAREPAGDEVLWGATYFIAVAFLERAFGFRPPQEEERPEVTGTLAPDYATGSGR